MRLQDIEHYNRILRRFESIRSLVAAVESASAVAERYRRIAESVSGYGQLHQGTSFLNDALNRETLGIRDHIADLASVIGPAQSRESISSLLETPYGAYLQSDVGSGLADSLKIASDPLRNTLEAVSALQTHQRILADVLPPSAQAFVDLISDAQSNPLWNSIRQIDHDQFAVGDTTLSKSNFSAFLEELDEYPPLSEKYWRTVIQTVTVIGERFGDGAKLVFIYLLKPLCEYFVVCFIMHQLNGTAPALIPDFAKPPKPIREIERQIIICYREQYEPSVLVNYRFVSVRTYLNVRTGPGQKYDTGWTLDHGTPVRLIGKSDNYDWSLIEYENTLTGELEQGWVFSRYLRKFENKSMPLPKYRCDVANY